MALEPKTGGVRGVSVRLLAMIKLDFRNSTMQLNQNVALVLQFKPLVVYTPAVEAGWALNKQLDNHTMQYDSYKVDNYAGIKTSREVPMYQALAESLNLPAVATVNAWVLTRLLRRAKKFGLQHGKGRSCSWV